MCQISRLVRTKREILKMIVVGIVAISVCLLPVLLTSCGEKDETIRGAKLGPIIVGHQADLTGGISSRGYWLDKAAKAAVEDFERTFNLERFKRLDEELISRGINPGSIADLTTAAIFLALRDGLRF